jgi:hypothetical protein
MNRLKDIGCNQRLNSSLKGKSMTRLRSNIPAGKTRVIGVDLFDHGDYLVGDYDDQSQALQIAGDHNARRRGQMDDIYYVYNDQGEYLRANLGAVKVSP